jgi:hypothetical protein
MGKKAVWKRGDIAVQWRHGGMLCAVYSEQATPYDVRFYDIDGFKADEVDIPTSYG